MNAEIQKIIISLEEVLSGKPWYGKSILTMFNEVDPSIVYQKPNEHSHSIIDLIYHMTTWSDFTKHRLEMDQRMDSEAVDALDWRVTNPELNTWNNGIGELTASTNKILVILKASSDDILDEKVNYREYDFRHLLNGLIQHNIYHLGQIAYVKKLLA